ncbi:MAG: hypothetical protein GXO09_01800 [Crenarchaeota archaeon]|nr:hypothetical protein [Thermoproteota archaeon]
MHARARTYRRTWIDIDGLKISMYRLVKEREINVKGGIDIDRVLEQYSTRVEALKKEAEKTRGAYIVELILEETGPSGHRVIVIGEAGGSSTSCMQAMPRPTLVKRIAAVQVPSGRPKTMEIDKLKWVNLSEPLYVYDLCVKGLKEPIVILFDTPEGVQAAIIEPGSKRQQG